MTCTTLDCGRTATHEAFVDDEPRAKWHPYCAACAEMLDGTYETRAGAITDEMIEAGARAYYDAETEVAPPLDPPWEEAIEPVRAQYRKAAQIVLAAALPWQEPRQEER